MEVLLIGQADSIFFEHYTKTIKKIRPDINFDIFSVDDIVGKYDLSACNNIVVNKWSTSFFSKIKGIRSIVHPFYTWFSLYSFLKKNKKKYHIIHIKWLISGVILFPNLIKKFADKSIATFWGSEFENQKILFSKYLYEVALIKFLIKTDVIANRSTKIESYVTNKTNNKSKFQRALYGSNLIEEIQKLSVIETKVISKTKIGIPENRITLTIGYSGKALHQHIKIIEELFALKIFNDVKNQFHFILPLNYGCGIEYFHKVENTIQKFTCNYTIFFSKKFTDVEIARLRIATDILIQLSISDGLSSSIIESFYSGSIVISGKWLPYEDLRKSGLHFYELDKISYQLPVLILKLAKGINNELLLCQHNKNIWDYNAWEEVIPNWIDIYEKVLIKDN